MYKAKFSSASTVMYTVMLGPYHTPFVSTYMLQGTMHRLMPQACASCQKQCAWMFIDPTCVCIRAAFLAASAADKSYCILAGCKPSGDANTTTYNAAVDDSLCCLHKFAVKGHLRPTNSAQLCSQSWNEVHWWMRLNSNVKCCIPVFVGTWSGSVPNWHTQSQTLVPG